MREPTTSDRRGLAWLTAALLAVVNARVAAQPAPPPYALTLTIRRAPASDTGFGSALAVCPDGRFVVGAPGSAGGAGAVWAFGADGGKLWVVTDPAAVVGDRFGAAVACFGTTVVAGAPGTDVGGTDAGAAYVIDVDPDSPAAGTVVRTLTSPAPHAGDAFGRSVAAGAAYLAVGAPFADDGGEDAGAVFVFDAGPGANPTSEPLVVRGAPPTAGDYFGAAVALHGDRLLIGAPFDSAAVASAGAAHLVTLGGSPVGVTARHVLRAPDAMIGAAFGTAVALDGARAVVGAPFELRGSGSAYVFDLAGIVEHTLRRPTPVPQDAFGAAVAVSDAIVVVGAPVAIEGGGGPTGAAAVFDARDGAWRALLPDPLARRGGRFAAAVAASGATAFAGALVVDRAVHVFAPCGAQCSAGCGNGIVEPVPTVAHAAADACDDAFAIDALPFDDIVDVGDATASPADPPHAACASGVNTGSVWYRFTATATGTLVLDPAGSDYPTVLAVYSGSCATPSVVECQAGGALSLPVQAGVTYLIEAAGGTGRLELFVGPAGSSPEPCDDGNLVSGDGCEPGCLRPSTTTSTTTSTTSTSTAPTTTTTTTTTTSTFQGSTSTSASTTSTTTSSTTSTTLPGTCTADDDCTAGEDCREPGLCRVCNGCGLIAWPCCGKPRRCAPGVPRADGIPCDDADGCTTGDACVDGACAGTPRTCPAPAPCDVALTCDSETGSCVATPRLDGAACDDGNPCFQDRTCDGGTCQGGSAVTCPDDGVECTAESCSPAAGCTSVPTSCTCNADADCASANPCLAGACVAHTCVQVPVTDGTACRAASACVNASACEAGTCVTGSSVRCDDGDPCTADLACDPVAGCRSEALGCFDDVTCRLARWQSTASCSAVTVPPALRGALERARRVVVSASSTGPRRARASLAGATRALAKAMATAHRLAQAGVLPADCAAALRIDVRQARSRLLRLSGSHLRACLSR